MKRTNIYLTEEERRALKILSEKEGRSQSQIIREAVDRYIRGADRKTERELLERGFGLWRDRTDLPDFVVLRRELDRDVWGGER